MIPHSQQRADGAAQRKQGNFVRLIVSATTARSYSGLKYGVTIPGQTSITSNAPVGIG